MLVMMDIAMIDERIRFPAALANEEDPAKDNYTYFLNTEGDIFERYKRYNGLREIHQIPFQIPIEVLQPSQM